MDVYEIVYLYKDVLVAYAKTKSSNKTFTKIISSADSTDEDDSTFYFGVGTKS
ncbi:MAG: hypothetical protein ACJ0PU_04620 [Flavobacteriaceae bacterium]